MIPTTPQRIYLAGPMRTIPEFNFPRFNAVAKALRAQGHYVFNPAQRDTERHGGVDISSGQHGRLHREGESAAWVQPA